MIEHLVWFKLKENVKDEDTQAMLTALRALPNQIEGIEHLACGLDFSTRSRGFQVGLSVRFATREDLEIYATHPIHLEFIAAYKPLWEDVMALDFEA
jgi:hypothetical protein